MILSILKRYPNMNLADIELRNDGNGPYIEKWNSEDPQPSMAEVNQWVAEDESLPKPLTPLEELQKQQADLIFELVMNGVI